MKRIMIMSIILGLAVLISACSLKKSDSENVPETITENKTDSNGKVPEQQEQQPEPDEAPVEPVFVEYPIVEPNTCITEELLHKYVDTLCAKYPEILSQGTYGTSVMGRPLVYLTMGTGDTEVCAVAGMHPWEHINSLYLLRCIEDYAEGWASEDGMFGEYDMQNLLEKYTIYLVPACNPDGAETCINGAAMNFTASPDRSILKSNANGVDLNRNFPYIWDEVDTGVYEPNERYYKGPRAGSEPETRALMDLCQCHEFQFMFSFHIQGKVIYWIDSTTGEMPDSKLLATEVGNRCGLELASTSTNKGVYGGGFENWFREAFGRPGFCLELIAMSWDVEVTSESFRDAASYLEYDKTKYALPEAMQTLLDKQ